MRRDSSRGGVYSKSCTRARHEGAQARGRLGDVFKQSSKEREEGMKEVLTNYQSRWHGGLIAVAYPFAERASTIDK